MLVRLVFGPAAFSSEDRHLSVIYGKLTGWLGVPGSYRKFFNLAQLNCDLEEYLSAAMQDFLSMYGKMCFSCMIFLMV